MSRLDWRRCKKGGSDGSDYDPFKKKRPWQDPDRNSCSLTNLLGMRRELARLKRENRALRRADELQRAGHPG